MILILLYTAIPEKSIANRIKISEKEKNYIMCGRYQAWVEDDEIVRILEIEKRGSAERYLRQDEVTPGTVQPVLYGSAVRVRAHLSYWGVRVMPRDGGAGRFLINVRAETAAEKERFRTAFSPAENARVGDGVHADRRAAVATSGYYEWREGVKYRISPAGGGTLYLGALEIGAPAEKREGDPGRRHLILTTQARGEIARIHSRMPLFLLREELDDWLYDPAFARRRLMGEWVIPMRVAEVG